MSNTFSLDDYIQPSWSAQPCHKYYFEIIKDGCVLGKLDVKQKNFNLIGRLEDLCDIVIDNHTVSRKHAILQAKADDHCLYLYDLGSAHGTFVNKQKLPPRTYKKLIPFDNVKFGISSRLFILRCPAYEEFLNNQQAQKDNKFLQLVENQHRQLSKAQLKQRYLDLLQNDPNFAANQAPRKLKGRQQEVQEDEYEGIDWGISDQREIYGYKNDNQFPIEPDILRRLNLDSNQLNKLAQYEDNLRKYQQIQGQLNELTSREKRQYGLQQKLQSKKDKLQRRFVEAVEALQKSQDWLRGNIFGQVVERNAKNIIKIRQKQNDTFGDDEYFDRTLQNRQNKQNKKIVQKQQLSTEDYWKIEKQLNQCLKKMDQLKDRVLKQQNTLIQGQQIQMKDEDDELQVFMKDNNKNLNNQNTIIIKRQQQILLEKIQNLKLKLKNIVGEVQLNKMTSRPIAVKSIKQHYKQKSLEESLLESKKKMQLNQNIQNILNRLENIQQQQEQLNQLDPSILNFYKGRQPQNQDQPIQQEEGSIYRKRNNPNYQSNKFVKPISKHRNIQQFESKQQFVQQDFIDLTKKFK